MYRGVLLELVVDDNSDGLALTQPQDWPGDTIAISPNRSVRPIHAGKLSAAWRRH